MRKKRSDLIKCSFLEKNLLPEVACACNQYAVHSPSRRTHKRELMPAQSHRAAFHRKLTTTRCNGKEKIRRPGTYRRCHVSNLGEHAAFVTVAKVELRGREQCERDYASFFLLRNSGNTKQEISWTIYFTTVCIPNTVVRGKCCRVPLSKRCMFENASAWH